MRWAIRSGYLSYRLTRWLPYKNMARALIIVSIFCFTWMPETKNKDQWFWWINYIGNAVGFIGLFILLSYVPIFRKFLILLTRNTKKIAISEWQWVAGATCAMLAITATVSTRVFERLPHVADTYAQYIQGRIFSYGEWFAPSHAYPQFFDTQWFINDGKFYSQYPPGHALLLALGHLAGAPWLVNPLLAALAVIIVYALTREIGNRYSARLATILMLISPFIIFMGSEYMNHMTAAVCVWVFALFYIRTHRYGHASDAMAAGLAFGYLCITRPQLAVPFSIPFAAHWVFTAPRRIFWRCSVAMGMACGVGMVFFLYYNMQTTGDPWLTGYEKLAVPNWQPRVSLLQGGFGAQWEDIKRMVSQLQELHVQLFAWPTTSLGFVWLLFQLRLAKPYCGLLIASVSAIALSLMLTPYNDGIFGPRYLFEAGGLCLVLTALCIARLPACFIHAFQVSMPLSQLRNICWIALAVLVVSAIPGRMVDLYRKYSNHYWEGNPSYYFKLAQARSPALIFIGGNQKNYFSGSLFNPPRDDAPIIAAHDLGADDQKLIDQYPDRFVYRADDQGITLYRSPIITSGVLPSLQERK